MPEDDEPDATCAVHAALQHGIRCAYAKDVPTNYVKSSGRRGPGTLCKGPRKKTAPGMSYNQNNTNTNLLPRVNRC
jgi:hypothetical protein